MSTLKLPRFINQLGESIQPQTRQERRGAQLMALGLAAIAALALIWRWIA